VRQEEPEVIVPFQHTAGVSHTNLVSFATAQLAAACTASGRGVLVTIEPDEVDGRLQGWSVEQQTSGCLLVNTAA
jgi:hypothetical protein